MERIVYHGDHAVGVEQSDVRLARDMVSQDISKLYLMSYYWTILAMTTVGNLPHPTTKVQYVYVIFQLLGKLLRLTICSADDTIQSNLYNLIYICYFMSLALYYQNFVTIDSPKRYLDYLHPGQFSVAGKFSIWLIDFLPSTNPCKVSPSHESDATRDRNIILETSSSNLDS